MNIREATADDAESISKLVSGLQKYLNELGDPTRFHFNASTYLRDGFGENPAFLALIAEIEDKAAGYLLYHFGYDTDYGRRLLYVVDLYVDEAYRGHGIGKALMKQACEVAQREGATVLVWGVYERNELALRFYERLGARYIKGIHLMSIDVEALSREST
ncbi:MAG TPA: GNAT family N-acetyltransferase [Pyrinomonadaceae bacterium]|nr:GNAT family N-acetyltransferase [Pyrinomonadaceae bacterium]